MPGPTNDYRYLLYHCDKCGWTADATDASFFGIPQQHTRCPQCNRRLIIGSPWHAELKT